jgi:hypothetical protein
MPRTTSRVPYEVQITVPYYAILTWQQNGRPLEDKRHTRERVWSFLRCADYEATCIRPTMLRKHLLIFVVVVVVVGEFNIYIYVARYR